MSKSLSRSWYDIATKLRFFLWDGHSSHDYSNDEPVLEQAVFPSGGNIYSSEIDKDKTGWEGERRHIVAVDVDIPAVLVPSSTPGHQHLLIDVDLTWDEYAKLLDALEAAGIIEPGYNEVAHKRRATHIRVPWEVKEPQEQGMGRKVFHEAVEEYEKQPPAPIIPRLRPLAERVATEQRDPF